MIIWPDIGNNHINTWPHSGDNAAPENLQRKKKQSLHQALQLMHPACDNSAALSFSIALRVELSFSSAEAPLLWSAVLALRILSTSTVNLMASAAAFVRR